MKKQGLTYPLTFDEIAEKQAAAALLFTSRRRHRGAFLGLCVLEGAFACDEPERVFATLGQGERLSLSRTGKSNGGALRVLRSDGCEIGFLPFGDSLIPNALIDRGLAVYCFAEAKKLQAGLLNVAVSVYCEDY